MTPAANRIAAIVPCHNEALTVGNVVRDLKAAVPGIDVYVYDNKSSDGTDEVARQAGAIVRYEGQKGKGNVIRRAFGDVDADIYVLIDGDDTYDASSTAGMIDLLLSGPYDHILGVRKEESDSAYRPGHSLGNKAFNGLVSNVFNRPVSDMLSGFRVFSRRFVKSFPAISREFEIETELTVHSMSLRLPQAEMQVGFRDRPEGSESKLNTYRDGFRILSTIGQLLRYERPLLFHTVLGGIVVLVALLVGIPVLIDFLQTGLVAKLPSAILAASLMTIAVTIWLMGIVLDSFRKARHESARLFYLSLSAPAHGSAAPPPKEEGITSVHRSDATDARADVQHTSL